MRRAERALVYAGPMTTIRAAKYPRISDDAEGQELGVTRQNEDLDTYITRKGYTPVGGDTYGDNDIGASAQSRTKIRPGYNRLLADARAGVFEVIVAYTASRLTRRPREFEDLIDLSKQHGIRIEYINSPSFDLNTADGKQVARMLAANDAAEAERIAERIARARLQKAQKGLASGGHRPFGYVTPDGPIDAAEAALIRAAADRLLAGDYIAHLVDGWNTAGVKTPRGSTWARNSLLTVLTSPRVAGVAFYQGEPLRDKDGVYVPAQWPAIIDIETWEAVCAKLAANKHGRAAWHTYLLSGTVRCSCGALMYGGAIKGKPHVYRCQPEKGGCGGRSISGVHLDAVIGVLVEAKIAGLTADQPVGPVWEGETEMVRAEQQKAELYAAWKAGALPGTIAFPRMAELEEEIGRLRAAKSTAKRVTLPPVDVLARWKGDDPLLRREIVKRFFSAVLIHPAPRGSGGGRGFDPTRIEPIER